MSGHAGSVADCAPHRRLRAAGAIDAAACRLGEYRQRPVDGLEVKSIGVDSTPFKLERDPGNPAADENGMVKMPNVDVLVELADMREANRSYEANLQVAKQSADMLNTAVSLMKDA